MPEKVTKTQRIIDSIYGADAITFEEIEDDTGLDLEKIKSIVSKLKREGWNVKADLLGYEKPSPIGKYKRIPDIEATKPGSRRIVEVEGETEDKEQIRSFRQSARMRPRTKFILKKTKKRK